VLRILQERKWKIYQGHTSTQIALAGSNFVYFYCYNWLKASLVKSTRQTLSSLQNLFASYLAGILNVLITNPLWVINMRLKAKEADTKYTKGFFDCGSQIITQEGPSTLWNGTFASLILVSNPVIHFFSYETMKQKLKHHLGKSTLNALEIFLLGAFAKTWTTIITYPLQLIQTRMRVMTFSKDEQQKKVNLLSCLNQIYRYVGTSTVT
jgi:adenine nucleotide transporter 17